MKTEVKRNCMAVMFYCFKCITYDDYIRLDMLFDYHQYIVDGDVIISSGGLFVNKVVL